jgi:dTMP kinase
MQGKLIVLEGIDGSGKSTQYKRLCERLDSEGTEYRHIVFPRYSNESSALVRMYLRGDFGSSPGDVNPYAASTFFAVDRYASFKTEWSDYYLGGGVVLSDRYTTSNAVHQGSKLPDGEMERYFDWLYDFEFRLMGLPKPDLVIYLDIDIDTALSQIRLRQAEIGSQADIHETDAGYLKNCLRAGRAAARHLGWKSIACLDNGRMRSVEDIHADIYGAVRGTS